MPPSSQLEIIAAHAATALSPAQKRFNTLLRQIEKAKVTLQAWQTHASGFAQSYDALLKPLRDELLRGHKDWVRALDAALAAPGWTQAEKAELRDQLCGATIELLEGSEAEDAELQALFKKHAGHDFETELRERALAFKDMTEAMTGLDLGDDEDLDGEEDLFQRLERGFSEREKEMEKEEEGEAAAKAPRRPSAAQRKREAEAQQATQSVREVYRKLASALHPDREPDPEQRAAKTALMQRVNSAYAAHDLLALLQLQLEIEQIDASHIAQASEQRIKHYNKVLAGQLAELKAEAEDIEFAFCMNFSLQPGVAIKPDKLGLLSSQIQREWRAVLIQQQRDLRMLGDKAAAKRWLKQLRKQSNWDVPF